MADLSLRTAYSHCDLQCGIKTRPFILPGHHDSSGIRLYYTATLRRYDAGIMELGLVYTPVMAIPPGEPEFFLTGYCTDKCTQVVSMLGESNAPSRLFHHISTRGDLCKERISACANIRALSRHKR